MRNYGGDEMAKIRWTEYEIELIRFCAQHYLDKGEILGYAEFPRYEELGHQKILETRARFMRFGLMEGVSTNAVRVLPAVLDVVEQLDNPPLPDYRDWLTKWFWSKPWSIVIYILIVGLPAALGWVIMLKTILEWLGVRKSL